MAWPTFVATVALAISPTMISLNVRQAVTHSCPVTKLNDADAPGYYNSDRSMSIVDVRHWKAGVNGIKVPWTRPAGTTLTIVGRRLDSDDAAPLKADVPCCYRSYFQATRLHFPSPGCWEITARAGSSQLMFVAEVPSDLDHR
jgi:hypothetical protein